MGKGSKRRPTAVSQAIVNLSWEVLREKDPQKKREKVEKLKAMQMAFDTTRARKSPIDTSGNAGNGGCGHE